MNISRLPSLAIAGGILLGSSLLASAPAEAFILSFDSTSFSSNTPATGASATVDFAFSNAGTEQVQLDLTLLNTTGSIPSFGDGATQATLVGFGFDLPDLVTDYSYDSASSSFIQLYDPATLQPFGTFDLGIRSAGPGNFTGGNPTNGLTAGESATVSFLFDVSQGVDAASLETAFQTGFNSTEPDALKAATRFQQVNAGEGSDKLLYQPSTPDPDPQSVPEPSILFGLTMLGGALKMLRRQQA